MKRFVITAFSVIALMSVLAVGAFAVSGDMNKDGTVTAGDARTALIFALGIKTPTAEEEECGDVIKDGYINIDDAREILKIAADIIPPPEHTYTPWRIITFSTCSEHGKAQCRCSHCGEIKYKELPLSKHTLGTCEDCKRTFPLEFYSQNKTVLLGSTEKEVQNTFGVPSEKILNGKKPVLIYSNKSLLNVFMFDEDDYLCAVYTTDKKSLFTELTTNVDFSTTRTNINDSGNIDYYVCRDTKSKKVNDVYGILAYISGTNTHTLTDKNSFKCFEKVDYYLVNQVREMNGLEPYFYSKEISEAAHNHCVNMAKNKFFGHQDPDGNSPIDRILETGAFSSYKRCGENICAATPDVFTANNGWYNSSDHRPIILSKYYVYIGIGFYYDKNSQYKYYGVQDFLA